MIKPLLQIIGILHWHKRTFPRFSCQQQQEKLAGEIREYLDALEHYINTGKGGANVKEELADIVIAATNLYRYKEMRDLIACKMAVNHKRTWRNGQHRLP